MNNLTVGTQINSKKLNYNLINFSYIYSKQTQFEEN